MLTPQAYTANLSPHTANIRTPSSKSLRYKGKIRDGPRGLRTKTSTINGSTKGQILPYLISLTTQTPRQVKKQQPFYRQKPDYERLGSLPKKGTVYYLPLSASPSSQPLSKRINVRRPLPPASCKTVARAGGTGPDNYNSTRPSPSLAIER